MRIALVTETFLPKVDGIVNTLCHLLEHLGRRGHKSMLLAPAGGPARFAETEVVGLRAVPFPLYPELRLVTPIATALRQLQAFTPDEDMVRDDLIATRKVCEKYGCPLEIILKDISTVRYEPQRLFKWAEIAMQAAGRQLR